MVKLSAAIITFNEEHNIERCIKSLIGIVDEIVVVDSYSTDKTKDICLKYDVKFIVNEFKGHIQQKNYALTQTTYDHVLSLDADEALDDQLRESILKVKENFTSDGYFFNRLTNYVDKWVYHCGWYPDRKLRLFNKTKAKWAGVNPHDIIEMSQGSTEKFIKGNLLHYSYDSITDHVTQTNKFTTIAAKEAYSRGVRSNCFKIVTRPILKFFKDYILKRGFLDGRYGFIICFINSLSALLKYSKIKDLQDGRNIE
ncbi:glycosyltransferase family 2 protein [Bacteriovorax sp. DB6_IX]|uniref:glycosyltransferase family 2 protein n=1 Tax=Bacteriovorax sp. DB6_IX TaxID=1353530 RepID=UPI00038A220F|nr:glycosyltransferase family 2 protein [Bacteriovorax sp. DB6_IX]EQC52554.1 glycosyltransferase, group 2 family protein [Bacteriovorax sp. DB6_IX]